MVLWLLSYPGARLRRIGRYYRGRYVIALISVSLGYFTVAITVSNQFKARDILHVYVPRLQHVLVVQHRSCHYCQCSDRWRNLLHRKHRCLLPHHSVNFDDIVWLIDTRIGIFFWDRLAQERAKRLPSLLRLVLEQLVLRYHLQNMLVVISISLAKFVAIVLVASGPDVEDVV